MLQVFGLAYIYNGPRLVEILIATRLLRQDGEDCSDMFLGFCIHVSSVSRGTIPPPHLPSRTNRMLMSLGDIPGMRLAPAIVSGSIRVSFCRASVDRDRIEL